MVPITNALSEANEKKLDLVEVAPLGKPVVCKLLDYGRFSYREKKRRNEARSKQRQIITKMVKFRPNTFEGDYQVKLKRINHFLQNGDKVKVVMQFKGREINHLKQGFTLFQRIADESSEFGFIDAKASAEGRLIHMLIAPSVIQPAKDKVKVNGNKSVKDPDPEDDHELEPAT